MERSLALNNIPLLQIKERVASILAACEICSLRTSDNNIDGACNKCSLIITSLNRYAESNIPIEYWNLKMTNFTGDPKLLAKFKEYTADLRSSFINGVSICFAGAHGVGKTFTCTSILKKACHKGYSCLYTTLSDIVSVLTQAPNEEKWLARRELTMVNFLVIDEFDSRFLASDNAADLYARTLEGIFRTRAQNKIPTLICTNSPNILEAFNGTLKQSIGSLMSGYLKTVIVLGEDHRKQNEHH
jgi:DNA replication protein DnaC